MLQRYDYNLSKNMGTVLKEKKSFDRLDDIRANYAEAFFEDAKEIMDVLNSPAIDALSAVRNLIVHRSSIVDQRYLNRTKSLTEAPKAPIGAPLLLDGQIVLNLVNPVTSLGCDLILAVDRWLCSH